MDLTELLSIAQKLGFPLWSAAVVFAAVSITRAVTRVMTELRGRDELLQKTLMEHIAHSDKRSALMEQLLERHDDNIGTIFRRLDNSGNFRTLP